MVLRRVWVRRFRIRPQNSEIQNGGTNMGDKNATRYLIGIKFGTWGHLGSLITYPRSTFRNQDGGFNMVDQKCKQCFIRMKFGTRQFSGSLITNSSSKFINSKCRIQYGEQKCEKLLGLDEIWYSGVLWSRWSRV